MMVCGAAMFGMATLTQAQDQNPSTDYNNPPVEQSTPPAQDQPTLDQPTQEPPVIDQPTQEQPQQDPALDQPTQEPVEEGTNAIPQGQSRESEQPIEDQTDQSMERPSEITPVEGKQGPNGEAIFMENGKYYYMDEAGEKKKIKKSELEDKTQ